MIVRIPSVETTTMPPYAGFKSIGDYIEARRLAQRPPLSRNALARELDWPLNYIHEIYHGAFLPSKPRAEKLARYFGDDPHLVRVLAGVESPPKDDPDVMAAADLFAALDKADRKLALRMLRALAGTK